MMCALPPVWAQCTDTVSVMLQLSTRFDNISDRIISYSNLHHSWPSNLGEIGQHAWDSCLTTDSGTFEPIGVRKYTIWFVRNDSLHCPFVCDSMLFGQFKIIHVKGELIFPPQKVTTLQVQTISEVFLEYGTVLCKNGRTFLLNKERMGNLEIEESHLRKSP